MDNKTIKELAVELTVEITAICNRIKGRSVFVNQLLRSFSPLVRMLTKLGIPKVGQILQALR